MGEGAYLATVLATLERVEQLRELLEEVRGKNFFLETEWAEGKLICRATNPRPADRKWKPLASCLKGGKASGTD